MNPKDKRQLKNLAGFMKGDKPKTLKTLTDMLSEVPIREMVDKPDHEWNGTKLKFETPEGEWGDETDLKGEKGEDGEKGEPGEKGEDGYIPIKGVDYFTQNEIDEIVKRATPIKGVHYSDGNSGRDGRDGKDGQDGMKGEDGNPLQIEDVVMATIKALKELKGNDRIDISNIRNYEQLIGKQFNGDDQRWHGGGISANQMANLPENLSAQCNGINTVFTTLNIINSIIWLSLNGQHLIEGSDFTKTGQSQITITDIIPGAGEALFIKYV